MNSNSSSGNHTNLVLADMGSIRGTSVRYLSSYAKSKGFNTKLLFPLIATRTYEHLPRLTDAQKELVLEFLNQHNATHLGFYLMTGHYRAFEELVSYLRQAGWKGCIIAGGIHAEVRPEECLTEGVDYIVRGPGEQSLIDILQDRPAEQISGLVYRSEGDIVSNDITTDAFIELNDLPFPDYSVTDHYTITDALKPLDRALYQELSEWGGKYYYLTTSRGCPYRCAYCCNVNSHKLRRMSVDRIIEELRAAVKQMPFLCGVNIQDDCFGMSSDEWMKEFSEKYKKEIDLPFIVRLMPKFCKEERIKLLKAAGLRFVSIGLQGSERENAQLYNRRESNATFINACQTIRRHNIAYVIDVILDVVYETEDDLREIARTLNQLDRPFKVLAYSMTVFPGTDFHSRVENDGLLDRFGADPYESMFKASKPNAYSTPLYWRRLIRDVIPLYSGKNVEALIESDPSSEEAVRSVERLYEKSRAKMRRVLRLKNNFPRLFTFAVNSYLRMGNVLKRFKQTNA